MAGYPRLPGHEAPTERRGDPVQERVAIAESIAFIVTRPRHVAVNEILIRPTEQV